MNGIWVDIWYIIVVRPVYMQILLNMNDWIIETILNYDQDKNDNKWLAQPGK